MLSTEKPCSPGPSETSPLKNSCKNFITIDERSSDDNKVDLFESGLEAINQRIPKFSIRDYVFGTRANDMKAHWPFSQKNLQLCLENGVKDVLPPFEALGSVRNPSSAMKYVVRSTSDPSVHFFTLNEHLSCGPPRNANQNPALEVKLNALEKDREYLSAVTNVSCNHVKPNSQNSPFSEKPETTIQASNTRSKSPYPNNMPKKSRLIVKLGHNDVAEQKSSEGLLEITMGSKVCPVCKTFTSSSNTTLNAHIDQCLSGESMGNSRVVKHRIRPRKVRSMVEIYETAPSSTLEDLDNRNRTNWAFPAPHLANDNKINSNISIAHNNYSSSSIDGEDKNKEGDVYFDSNGTKLRILSRFSHVKLNNITNEDDDCGTRKLVERDKASKILVVKKKKRLVPRHKLLKCPFFVQSRFNLIPQENEKEVSTLNRHMKSDGSEMIKQWAGSKRCNLEKKKNPEHESRHRFSNKNTKKSSITGPCQSSLDDKLTKRSNDLRFSISSDDSSTSASDLTHKREGIEALKPLRTNRAGFGSFASRKFEDAQNRSIMLPKTNFKRLKDTGPLLFNGSIKDQAAFCRNKKMRRISSTFGVKKLPPLNRNPLVQLQNVERDSRNLSIDRSKFSEIYEKKWEFSDTGEEGSSYSNHSTKSEPNSHGVEQDMNSSLTDTCPAVLADAIEAVEIQEEFFHKPNLEMLSPITAAFGDSLAYTECENEAKGNYFIDIDPIPIPGPPGSFLPSPGRAGSEELHGNSSLTLMIHSPKDNGLESDSPNSYCIPVAERPLPFEHISEVEHQENDGPRADLVSHVNKFRGCGYCESPGSSTPYNPILRLMGKNLMVVKDFPNLQSNGDSQNKCHSFCRNVYQGPPSWDYLHFQSSLEMPGLLPNLSRAMIWSTSSNEGSFECQDQLKSAVKLNHPPPIRQEFGKRPVFVPQVAKTQDSCRHEIVVSPKDGARLAYNEACSKVGGLGYEWRHLNSVFGRQTLCYPFPNGSQKTVGGSNTAQMHFIQRG